MSADPEKRLIEANSLTHHVLVWNTAVPGDATVVLLHGFLDLAWSFTRLAQTLAQHYRVVAPDWRGHGDSGWVGGGGYYYFMDYAADLARLLPALAHGRVYLVGHSLGGMVATCYAGAYPDRVQRLALLEGTGPPAGDPEQAPERLRLHVDTVDAVRAAPAKPLASIAAAAQRLLQRHPRLEPQWAQTLAEQATRPAPEGPPGSRVWKFDPLHRTRTPLPFSLPAFAAFARRIHCPVLLVDGALTEFAWARDRERQALYAQRTVATVPGAGHMLHLDQPQAVAELLLRFFAAPAT